MNDRLHITSVPEALAAIRAGSAFLDAHLNGVAGFEEGGGPGHPLASSKAEIRKVERLLKQGAGYREIAEKVWGDKRFKNRVRPIRDRWVRKGMP